MTLQEAEKRELKATEGVREAEKTFRENPTAENAEKIRTTQDEH